MSEKTKTEYIPDYDHNYQICGATPVVTLVQDKKVVHETSLCGVCTFGSADFADPSEW